MQCALFSLVDKSVCEKHDLHAESQLSIMDREFVSTEERCFQPCMPAVVLHMEYVQGNRASLVSKT